MTDNRMWVLVLLLMPMCAKANDFPGYQNYVYDANDFAAEVIGYSPVGQARDWLSGASFNVSENALGRPTVDTTGDDWYIPETDPVPVNPVYPAFRGHELTWLGEQGSLTVKFNHPVRDDENNPYGVDFIVFGNAFQVIGGGAGWSNGDPALTTVGSGGFSEPAIVSVSQDGVTWYSFTTDENFMSDNPHFIKMADGRDGPFCDAFAPTLGRVYDPEHADPNLGAWNQWWGGPTNPTCPLDPQLTFADFSDWSVAEICELYSSSAGGTGCDIARLDLAADPETGLKWFQYVRIDDRAAGGAAEIDAVSDVTCCGDWRHPYPAGDITRDCRVNMDDFAILANYWTSADVGPDSTLPTVDLVPDESVNLLDLAVLSDNWLACTWNCN